MTKTIEFYFDFGSPTSYLAYTQLPGIAERTGAELDWKPMLLGGVFQATGNQSPAMIPAKGAYMGIDMRRFADRYGVTFNANPYFPVNTLQLMRGAVSYQKDGDFSAYVDAIYKAMWVDARDMNDRDVVAGVLRDAGFDVADFERRVADASVKDALKKNTEEAVARGVFGAPTIFVDGEMFFGQDRLDFVEEAAGAM